MKKYCQDLPVAFKVPPCPSGYIYYDDWCYAPSSGLDTHAAGELACLPAQTDSYDKTMMYTANPRHWAHVAKYLQGSYWAGLVDRALTGFGITSYGASIALNNTVYILPGTWSGCGLAGIYVSKIGRAHV